MARFAIVMGQSRILRWKAVPRLINSFNGMSHPFMQWWALFGGNAFKDHVAEAVMSKLPAFVMKLDHGAVGAD
jgi:hypothetical protein